MKRFLTYFLVFTICMVSVACGGGGSKTPSSGQAATVTGLSVAATSSTVVAGQTLQLTAVATYGDGSTKDVTATATWQSSDSTVASVSSSGLVTAKKAGSFTASATSGTISGSKAITVLAAPPAPALSTIGITPASVSLAAGQTKQLKATGTYSDGSTQDLTSSVTWSSSNTAVAKVSASGLVTSLTGGQATITAVSGTVSSSAATINVTAAVISSVVVSPNLPSIATGQTQQFSATAIYTDGSATDVTTSVTWSSDNLSVATIDATGLAKGVASGTAHITATTTNGAVSSIAVPLVITSAVLTSIDISPDDQSIPVGGQVQYTVTGTYSDQSTQDLTNASFSSSAPAVAAIDSATGVATGINSDPAPVTITATVGSLTATTTLTVLPPTLQSISLTPNTVTLAAGTSQQFTVNGVFSDGSTEPLVEGITWTSSTPAVASVSTSGLLKAASGGQTLITAVYNGQTATAAVTVIAPTPSNITVTPVSYSMGIGGTNQFTATAVFTDGTTQDITADAQWFTSSAQVAQVDSTFNPGLVTALSKGTAQIIASFQGVQGSATLTVTSASLLSINVSPFAPTVPVHAKLQFTAVGKFSDGTLLPLANVSWRTSKANLANISGSGVLRTKKTGTVTVNAYLNGAKGSTDVSITSASLVSVAIAAPTYSTMAPGTVQQLSLIGTFADGNTVDVTKSAYWSTSNYHYAVINNSGLVTAVAHGTVTITATFNGLTPATADLTISDAHIESVTVTPATASTPLGSSKQFKATGNFDDSTSQDITTVSQWSSSSPSIAVVNQTGLATSAGRGTASLSATFKGTTGTGSLTVN